MKQILALLLFCSLAVAGTQDVVLTDSGAYNTAVISVSVPNSAPYNTSGTERIEGRISRHATVVTDPDFVMLAHGCMVVYWAVTTEYLRVSDSCDGDQSEAVVIDVCQSVNSDCPNTWANQDVVYRIQRNMTTRTFSVEVWPADLSTYKIAQNVFGVGSDVNTRAGTFGVGGQNASGDMSWLCWYSTLVTPNRYTPPTEACTGADLGNWQFEGNLNDSSGNGLNMTATSGPSYVTSLTYSPWVSVQKQSIRTGSTQPVTGQCVPLDGGTTATLGWTQIDALSALTLTNTTTATVSVAGQTDSVTNGASYQLRLSCTDGHSNTTTASAKIGARDVDAYGNVSQTAASRWFLGPLSFAGTPTGYGFFDNGVDAAILSIADIITNPTYQPAFGATFSSGNVSIVAPSYPLNVQGTNSWTGSTSAGENIFMAWNTLDGSGTGRYQFPVNSIVNTTTVEGAYGIESQVCGSVPCTNVGTGMYRRKAESGLFSWGLWGYDGASTTNWNYYDYAIAAYSRWEQTGIDDFKTAADTMGELWFDWGIDHAARWAEPRVRALRGTMYYLIVSGRDSTWWGFLQPMIADGITRWGASSNPTTFHNDDKRETGFALMAETDAARWDPDSTRHAAYCADLATQMGRFVSGIVTVDANHGYYSENSFVNTNFYVTYPDGDGNAPWRVAINGLGNLLAAKQFNDTSATGCNNTTLGAQLIETVRVLNNWIWDYGSYETGDDIRKILYNTGYHAFSSSSAAGTGALTTTLGSTAIVGSGTTFVSSGQSGGNYYIGIANADATKRDTFRIVSCSDNTHCTLDHGAADTGSGFTFTYAIEANTTCYNLASYCEPDGFSPTALTRVVAGLFAEYAYTANDSTSASRAQAFFKSAFAGAGSGPGYFDACTAPIGSGGACSNLANDTYSSLPLCASTGRVIPCLPGVVQWQHASKDLDEAVGVTHGLAVQGYINLLGTSTASTPGVRVTGNPRIRGSYRMTK